MRPQLLFAILWPGSFQAWCWGRWSGLALAAAFGLALNVAIVTTATPPLPWAATVPRGAAAAAAWLLVLGLWTYGLIGLRRDARRTAPGPSDAARAAADAQLQEAQRSYLKGHWFEAETTLARLLAQWPDDVEAQLLLVSVWRRTGRGGEARRWLARLAAEPAAARWQREIEAEMGSIDERLGTSGESAAVNEAGGGGAAFKKAA